MDNKIVELELCDCIKVRVSDKDKIISQIENIAEPLIPGRKMIYQCGSTNPVSRSEASFGGIDVKVHIVDIDEPYLQELEPDDLPGYTGCVGNIQAISFGLRPDDHLGGAMVMIIFDGMESIEKFLGKEKRLVLHAANEFGDVAVLADKNIRFDDYYSWGIGIDDIVTEVRVDFTELKDNRRCADKE